MTMELSITAQSMELTVPTTSCQDRLETQKDLLMSQVDNLQRIVAAQCELTGVNPLSQEMAAGALSIKIGKKPRDLLNPKAVKYMQLVFSVKDAISKKETREISAQFGVTATQVRDFFTSQRTRVRKFVRLAKEKADKSAAYDAMADGMPSTSEQTMPIAEPVPLDTIAPIKIEEGPSCSTQQEILPGVKESERYFIQNVFRLIRKEESFVGQIKLLEWILRMKNPSVLNWFLTEGGALILATWLSEAATEEQSTVLRVILKVFSHLPLEKSLPVHMSALLQSVNRLRFYRASDISNRSRILIADWSKLFRKMMEDSNKIRSDSDAQDEMILKQSIEEVMGDEAWSLKENNSGQPLRLCGNPENMKLDNAPSIKLLTLSGEDSKNKLGGSSSHARPRRKIQIVDQPGQRPVVRTSQAVKSTVSTERPLSADDIQKAKMRAQFLQNKHGKTVGGSENQVKPGSRNRVNHLQAAKASTSGSDSHVRPEIEEPMKVSSNSHVQPEIEEPKTVGSSSSHVQPEFEEPKKVGSSSSHVRPEIEEPKKVYSSNSHIRPEIEERWKVDGTPPRIAKTQVTVNVEEPPWKRLKRIQIPWRAPPDLKIMDSWSVGTGENSKEVEVQKNRNKRERGTIYRSFQEIPSNPRSPWDLEMDYDDTLTPIIPIEQLPDIESIETPTSNNENVTVASSSSSNMPEPDLQLLAELLKNPELVFALTSGQAGDLSSNETIKLLDLIKSKGASVLGNLAGVSGNAENNRVEVSLPSPTPSTDPVPNGLKPDFSRNPFTKQHATVNGGNTYQAPPSLRPQETIPASPFVLGPTVMAPQLTVQQLAHMAVTPVASLTTVDQYSEQWHTVSEPSIRHQMLNSSKTQRFSPEINPSNMANFNRAPPNLHNTFRAEPLGNVRVSPLARSQVQQVHYLEPNTLRERQGYESNYYHQNSGIQNNYNGYAGGGRNTVMSRPGYESFSPDNSPSRGYGHVPGRNYQDQANFRNGVGADNAQQPYGYRDNRDKRWNNHRR